MATTPKTPISDLLHRVGSTCLSSPCNGIPLRHHILPSPEDSPPPQLEKAGAPCRPDDDRVNISSPAVSVEVGALMEEAFEAVGALKRAYVRLQAAHCPWDPEGMRAADEAVISELKRLARLKERYRRRRMTAAALPLADAVAPYEAALEEARRELTAKEAEMESLKDGIRCVVAPSRKGKGFLGRKRGLSSLVSVPGHPTSELFGICFSEVKSTSKAFTRHLLLIMQSTCPDITSAIRSIVDLECPQVIDSHHAKHLLSSHLHSRLFCGFEDETFYMEGSLSSLLHPMQYRQDCYAQFRDILSMDPVALVGILPSCTFGRWAGKVYLSIMSNGMDQMLFEDDAGSEHRRVVEGGGHPRTGLYGEYLSLAKAVWMLHLLAFSLEPAPSHFEAVQGSEYHAEHMESVIRFPGGVPVGWVVGFPVAPGFKLGNGVVVPAQVYPVPRRQMELSYT